MPDPTERKALATCAFLAGCILLMPGERVAAGAAFVLAALLCGWHLFLARRASIIQRAVVAAPGPPPGD